MIYFQIYFLIEQTTISSENEKKKKTECKITNQWKFVEEANIRYFCCLIREDAFLQEFNQPLESMYMCACVYAFACVYIHLHILQQVIRIFCSMFRKMKEKETNSKYFFFFFFLCLSNEANKVGRFYSFSSISFSLFLSFPSFFFIYIYVYLLEMSIYS